MATTPHPLTDLSVLDAYSTKGFPPGYPADHRTFNAPTDRVTTAIRDCLLSVQHSLVVAMYSFTHPVLIDAVQSVIEDDFPVLVVLDSSCYQGESEQRALATLMAMRGKPNLRLSVGTAEDGRDIMHRKIGVIDGSVCVTGSFNWTHDATLEDNQTTIGIWPSDAALLTAWIEGTYAYQMANNPQPGAAA